MTTYIINIQNIENPIGYKKVWSRMKSRWKNNYTSIRRMNRWKKKWPFISSSQTRLKNGWEKILEMEGCTN